MPLIRSIHSYCEIVFYREIRVTVDVVTIVT